MALLNLDKLKDLVQEIAATRAEEIDCDECLDRLDYFVETELSGLDAAEAMPVVQDHLDKCADCREEFEALLAALRATEDAASFDH